MTKKLAKWLIIFLVILFGQLAVAESKSNDNGPADNLQKNQLSSPETKNSKILKINIGDADLSGKTSIILNINLPKSIKETPKKYKGYTRSKISNLESKAYNSKANHSNNQKINSLKAKTTNKQDKLVKTKISWYRPRIDTYYRQGNNQRSLGRVDIFLPLLQNKNNVLFFDLISTKDNMSSKEGNFGLGHRVMFGDKFILGYYGFYDYKISNDNNIMQQATLGGEFLTKNFDLRANLYLPKEKAQKTHYTSDGEAIMITNNALYASSGSYEAAMMGTDFEIGLRILDRFRLSTGYAHFESKSLNDSLDRFNSRIEYSLFTNDNHSLILDGEYIYQTNKNNDPLVSNRFGKNIYYGGLRYSYLFGQKQPGLTSLQARMNSRLIRDIDVVTTNKMRDGNIKIADIYTVGDGSNGEQYRDLKAAYDSINKNTLNPVILVSPGNYSSFSVNNKNNLKIIGLTQEANFKVGSTNKDICSITKCYFSKANIDLNDDKILVDNSHRFEIAGFNINASGSNNQKLIEINNSDSFYIHNNKLSGKSSAIEVTQNSTRTSQINISNNQFLADDSSTILKPIVINFEGQSENNLVDIDNNSVLAKGNGPLITIANSEVGSWGNLTLNISNNNFDLTKNGNAPGQINGISQSGNLLITNNNYSLPNQKILINYYYNTVKSNESYDKTLSSYHNLNTQNSLLGIFDSHSLSEQTNYKFASNYLVNGLKTNNIYYGIDGSQKLDMSNINSSNISHYYRTNFFSANEGIFSYKENDLTSSFYLYNKVQLNRD